MKSINAKLLISGLLLALLSGFAGLVVIQSNRSAAEIATAMIHQGIDPLDQLEGAARSLGDLERRFNAVPDSLSELPMLRTEEAAELLTSLTEIVRKVRGAMVALPNGGQGHKLDQLFYSINRLRTSEGDVTHRLVRRELANILNEVDAAIDLIRDDLIRMHERTQSERRTIDLAVMAGGAGGLMIGLLLILYLSRSISRPIRSAATILRQVAGAPNAGSHHQTNDMMADLEAAIRFVETVIETKDRSSKLLKSTSAAHIQAAVERQQNRLRLALDALQKPLCLVDEGGCMTDANAAFLQMFPGLTVGSHISSWTDHTQLTQLLAARTQDEVVTFPDGWTCRVRCHPNPIDNGVIAVFNELTNQDTAQRELERISSQDSLTGLLNRDAFHHDLENALRVGETPFFVVVVDVVAFKTVNTTLGLTAGDELLRAVGERLSAIAGPGGRVARLAGDEFGLIVRGENAVRAPERFGRVIVQDFARRPVTIVGRPLAVRIAVGVVPDLQPGSGLDVQTVMRDCEIALATAKKSASDPFCVYAPEIQKEHQNRQDIERDLREALARGEFELHFQPFVDVKRGCVSGFEALVRWNSPTRGRVSPGVFIPIMEETGLIVPLGLFVLRDACRQAAHWPEGLTLSINLSPRQFEGGDIVADVRQALAETRLDPKRLQLEVTESLFLSDGDRVLTVLNALRGLGVAMSMDDFGTGYSSLGYLSRFPFDKIKIDQSFVRDLDRKENMAIVRAVLGLGASMKLAVIAEGVETAEQMRVLQEEGCDEMQGYLFSRPRPAGDLPKMLVDIKEGFQQGRFGREVNVIPMLRSV
ncbi:putative bifunctional diguanylate cyclase/phosphodiesterase [Aureimonas sp. N4]|uniref:putative bifunctional diguanylate cyclase/phosphodiesterase n=1 Tax=Aureimonas sp. N4 TaxID=1638165 RepID=UPI0007842C6C|nr:EAL domain-containing protein [Aureimonas sp. N4]